MSGAFLSYDKGSGPGCTNPAIIISRDPSRDRQPVYVHVPSIADYRLPPVDQNRQTVTFVSRSGGLVPMSKTNGMSEAEYEPHYPAVRRKGKRKREPEYQLGLQPGQQVPASTPVESKEEKLWGGSGYGRPRGGLKRKEPAAGFEEKDEKEGLDTKHVHFAGVTEHEIPALDRPPGLSRKRRREEYPQPPKHPDQMTDAEYEVFAEALTDEQYDAFKEDFDLSDSDSESDEEKDDFVLGPAPPLPPPERPEYKGPPRPLATELPDGASGTPLHHVGEAFAQQGSGGLRLTYKERGILRQGMDSSEPDFKKAGARAPVLQKRYEESKKRAEDRKGGRELELFGSDVFRATPSYPEREVVYIVGPQGAGRSMFDTRYIDAWRSFSGKSTWCSEYVYEWMLQHPTGTVYLFSQKKADPALDRMGITRIVIDDGLITNPFQINEMQDSLVIFDDIDKISNEKLRKAVLDLHDSLIEVGRADRAWVLRTSHKLKNYTKTQTAVGEADKIVFFINKIAPSVVLKYLKDDLLWDKDAIECIVGSNKVRGSGLKSRWVMVNRAMPSWFLGENLFKLV